jgi:hypothetical protein
MSLPPYVILIVLVRILERERGPFRLGIAGIAHRLIAYETTITENDLTRGIFSNIGFMSHENYRQTTLIQCLKHCHDLNTGTAIQVARWLIGQEERGTIDEGASYGNTLLLTS